MLYTGLWIIRFTYKKQGYNGKSSSCSKLLVSASCRKARMKTNRIPGDRLYTAKKRPL